MTEQEEHQTQQSSRAWLIFALCALFGVAILCQLMWIQIDPSDRWNAQQGRHLPQPRTIESMRGQILSADGHLLATSVPQYALHWDPTVVDSQSLAEEIEGLCEALGRTFPSHTANGFRSLLSEAMRSQKSRYVSVVNHMTYAQKKRVEKFPFIGTHGRNKSGFIFTEKPRRSQPFAPLASRTIGIYRENAAHRVGIESAFDSALAGQPGVQLQRRIHGGLWIPASDDFMVQPITGLDVVTTINLRTQDVATESLRDQLVKSEAEWGCVVVLEVGSGDVVAISNFTRDAETGHCIEDYNHAVGKAVEPGSTFKLATMLALLERGGAHPSDTLETGDGSFKPSRGCGKMEDTSHDDGGYGDLKLQEVFERSSNVGTAMAVSGAFGDNPQRWLDALHNLGIGDKLGISLAGAGTPKIQSKVGGGLWSGCSLTSMSIGYEVEMTPLQTAAFYNAVASDGRLIRPRFVKALSSGGETVQSFDTHVIKERIASRSSLAAVQQMMEAVCAPGGHGTASEVFEDRAYSVAGKTGTVRASGPGGYQGHRASFAGYFPAKNPKYTIVVVVHRPKGDYWGSSVAAPVFRKIADHLFSTSPALRYGGQTPQLAATPQLPTSMDGNAKALKTVYAGLGMAWESDEAFVDGEEDVQEEWVRVETQAKQVQLNPRHINSEQVIDVRGMSLRDAISLLEGQGLRVKVNGKGTVRQQSIRGGDPLRRGVTIELELRSAS